MAALRSRYRHVRQHSLQMVQCLEDAEFYDQSVPEVSPPAWNLGHTTWFFDAIVLARYAGSIGEGDARVWYHFNSYYKGAGAHVRQACRGTVLINEISVADILQYRHDVDEIMERLFADGLGDDFEWLVELGIQHEQQHQELFYTELLHNRFELHQSEDLCFPAAKAQESRRIPLEWIGFDDAVTEIGNLERGFGFDNEYGVHKAYVHAFELMNRPVSNGEYLEFIEDGGYKDFSHWLAESWDDGRMQSVLRLTDREIWSTAPLYWLQSEDSGWLRFTLHGWQPLDLDEPVSHVSYFEATAYARWRSRREGAYLRLPTEVEWEHAARMVSAMDAVVADETVLLDGAYYRPVMIEQAGSMKHMIGNVWEWTNSAYLQYPGFRPYEGTIQEYNGKFMSNKMVLKGGSWATSAQHIRVSYRNFWPLAFRFAIPGMRLLREPS